MFNILVFELRQYIGALFFYMARVELHFRFGVFGELRWWLLRGGEVSVRWPSGPIGDGSTYSIDPTDFYQEWLEENVGKQGRDWEWKIAPYKEGFYSPGDRVLIRVRKSKRHALSAMALMWG